MKPTGSIFFASILYLLSLTHTAAQITLAPNAKVSLLTCTSGAELHAAFGHSALRIQDSEQQLDFVFNYGTFDFETPNFYLKFLNGELDYFLSVSTFEHFIRYYHSVGRGVDEQVLNLNISEKQQLFQSLTEQLKPENRFYRYEFLRENCATKIPEILESITEEDLEFEPLEFETKESFRSLIGQSLNRYSWQYFGVNIVLGSVVDRKLQPLDPLFLPEFVALQFDQTLIRNAPIVGQKRALLPASFVPPSHSYLSSPQFISLLILIAVIYALWRGKTSTIAFRAESALLIVFGVLGIVLLYMMFGTEHIATRNNFNILWLNPLILIALISPTKTRWLAVSLSGLFVMVVHYMGVQEMTSSFRLLSLALVLIGIRRALLISNSKTE
jgi:hypothetical protein